MQLLKYREGTVMKKRKYKRLLLIVITALLILAFGVGVSWADTSADGKEDENGDEFRIEVVEDIPASEIDDQDTPLANVMEDTGEAGFQAVSFAVPLAVLIIGILIIVLPGRIRRKRLATEELENIKKAFSEGANK